MEVTVCFVHSLLITYYIFINKFALTLSKISVLNYSGLLECDDHFKFSILGALKGQFL